MIVDTKDSKGEEIAVCLACGGMDVCPDCHCCPPPGQHYAGGRSLPAERLRELRKKHNVSYPSYPIW